MSEYKHVFHGNEVPFEDIELADAQIRNGTHPFSVIAEEYVNTYNNVLSEAISKIISNNLQV